MEKKIPITEDLSNYLESLDYTADALRTLLIDAAERGLQATPAFAEWEQRYIDAVSQFRLAKAQLEKQFVIPVVGDKTVNWSLDYGTHVVTISEVVS